MSLVWGSFDILSRELGMGTSSHTLIKAVDQLTDLNIKLTVKLYVLLLLLQARLDVSL